MNGCAGMGVEMTETIVVAVVTCLLSGLIAWLIAKNYGEVAGQRAAEKFEKDRARKARIVAIQALSNETARLRNAAKHNCELGENEYRLYDAVRMPTVALETAFLSQESIFLHEWDPAFGSELLTSVNEYLVEADSLNMRIDLGLALIHIIGTYCETGTMLGDVKRHIQDQARLLVPILDRLEGYLSRELDDKTHDTGS